MSPVRVKFILFQGFWGLESFTLERFESAYLLHMVLHSYALCVLAFKVDSLKFDLAYSTEMAPSMDPMWNDYDKL